MRPGLRHYVRGRLQRRLFLWFGFSIAAAGITTATMMGVINQTVGGSPWHHQLAGSLQFVANRFAPIWDDPQAREALATELATSLEVNVVLRDAEGATLLQSGACHTHGLHHDVVRDGHLLGAFEVCGTGVGAWPRWHVALALVLACSVLWAIMGRLARQLARPLMDVARVAQDIGAGKLTSRARLGRHHLGEVGIVAVAINDMAAKIEKQMADQRALLAMVSHELRTPLARLRVLIELGREAESPGLPRVWTDMEREIIEVDELVGKLLAQSRLDFAALSPQRLDPRTLAERALERAGLASSLLDLQPAVPASIMGDPTLLQRALANLLENAAKHGGGARQLAVYSEGDELHFAVRDAGPGLDGPASRLFEAFYQGTGAHQRDPTSLGLGLNLVRRIALAHQGRAYASNLPEGGACVGFTVALERVNGNE